jgi:hypothetical protein
MAGNKLVAIAVSAFILAFSSSANAGGPWIQKKDRVQIALTAAYSFYDSYFDANGNTVDLAGKVQQYEFFYFFNIGLTKKDDLSILTGLADVMTKNPAQTGIKRKIQGIDDTTIRYRRQIYDRHSALAMIAGLKIPGRYNKNYFNSPGDHSLDAEAGISYGEYYRERTIYWSADALARYCFGSPDNEVELDFEAGRVFDKRWLLRGLSSWIYTPGGNDIESTSLAGGSLPFNQVDKNRYTYGAGITMFQGSESSIGVTYINTYGGNNIKQDSAFYLSYVIQNR